MSGNWVGEMVHGENATNATSILSGSLTCAARSIRNPIMLPYSYNLTTTVRSFQTVFYILIFMFGISLNTLLIVLVAKYKKLQTQSFLIALQIVVLDLLLSSTVLMLRPITSIANRWLYGEAMCIITGYLYLTYLFLRALLMLVFVVDRFLSVFFLYSYPKHSSKIMLVASLATWVFAIMARTIGFPGILNCYSFVSTSFLCIHSSRCSTECARAANVNLGVILGPVTIIPVILYALLCWKAKKIKKHSLLAPSPSPCSSEGSSIDKSDIRQREWKANFTFFLLFVALFALTTPVVSLSLILAAVTRMNGPSPILYVLSSILSTMSSLLVIVDPIVIMHHRDIKDILGKAKKKLVRKMCSK